MEYLYCVLEDRVDIAKARVSGPVRPINMVSMMIIFPAGLRKGVIPVDKPTVPNADMSSKSI